MSVPDVAGARARLLPRRQITISSPVRDPIGPRLKKIEQGRNPAPKDAQLRDVTLRFVSHFFIMDRDGCGFYAGLFSQGLVLPRLGPHGFGTVAVCLDLAL
jgi:hypothetical protein